MLRRAESRSISKYDNIAGILFILPSFLGFLVITIFPIIFSFFLSFCEWDFVSGLNSMKFVKFDNFSKIFNDVSFVDSLVNTLIFTVATVIFSVSLGLVFATFISRYVYASNFFRIAIFLPYISSVVASSILWSVMLHPTYGPVNSLLMSLGMDTPPKWFADMNFALPTMIAFTVWQQLGYLVLVYMAGLKTIPAELYEAASIDGASEFTKFKVITVPMVSSTTFFLVVMTIINSFKAFDQIQVITNGGPGTATSVVALYIYRTAFEYYNIGSASAAAWILFIMIFLVTIVQWRSQKTWVYSA